MTATNKIQLFEQQKVRSVWDDRQEKWYVSIVDVIAILTESARPRKYWDDLKRKLQAEGSELSEKIGQLKLASSDGKKYLTDVADVEQLFRLIQSIPSPKAEPFKLWLAQLGRERLDQLQDPELSIEQAITDYRERLKASDIIAQGIALCRRELSFSHSPVRAKSISLILRPYRAYIGNGNLHRALPCAGIFQAFSL